jgi:predicted small secreted protein
MVRAWSVLPALAVLLGSALLAGCATTTGDGGDAQLTQVELPAAYAAALGALALDAVALEEAEAEIAAAALSNEAGQTDRTRLSDGAECYRDGEGRMVVEGPGSRRVVGTPEGPRQVRWGNGRVDGEYEPGQGDAVRDRIRLRLRDGECILVPPTVPGKGPINCQAPGGWTFTVEETTSEDGTAVTAFRILIGVSVIMTIEQADGTLVISLPDGSRWTAEIQDDGTILATSPAGHEWLLTVGEDGVTATGGPADRTFDLRPA